MRSIHTFGSKPIPQSATIIGHLNDKEKHNGFVRYNESKLLISLWVHQLSQHVESSKVLVNDVCPGLVNTNFDKDTPLIARVIMKPVRTFIARSAEEGARGVVFATILAGNESHGRFITDNVIKKPTPFILTKQGQEMQKKLWDETVAYANELQGSQ